MQTSRERTDVYADQGGYAYRKFQFACIRSGSSVLLKQTLASETYIATLVKLFCGDTAAALHALTFVAPQAWDAAVQAGIPEKEADRIHGQFLKNIHRCSNVEQMIKAYNRLMVAYADAVRRRAAHRKYSPRIQNARNYIAENIGEKLTVEQIADYLQVTPSYLSHTFKQETGQTLTAYMLSERIQLAKLMLLQPDATVGEVMDRLGFISQSHFTKAFREDTGMTPGKYQAAAAKGTVESPNDFLSRTDSAQIQSTWYLRAEEYGHRKGLDQQKALLNAIQTGNLPEVLGYFDSQQYQQDMQQLFRQDVVCAKETFICLWPQAVHAAVDGGLKKSASADMLRTFMPRLYRCQTATEVTALNRDFLVQLTKNVAKNK